MAAAATVDNPKNPAEADWTIVVPRRRNQKKPIPKILVSEIQKQDLVWAPSDTVIDADRELKLLQKMQSCIEKLENSDFFRVFLNQMQSLEMASYFNKVMIEPECKIPVVIYGIGSIESYESPCLQLGLAILLKKSLNWIGEIEVFDPIISFTESRVLMALGCSVISINEQGRREVSKPTLFYMPHCDAELYDNLLQSNWKTDSLNKIVLFGNSFEEYERIRPFCRNTNVADKQYYISAIQKFTKEFGIDTVSDYYFRAFNCLSWHFFSLDSEAKLDCVVSQ